MAYASGNPKTKKALRELIASGASVRVFSPGPFGCKANGRESLEGPHYPRAHTWYANVEVKDGVVVKVLS
jgi:hypothetical protein